MCQTGVNVRPDTFLPVIPVDTVRPNKNVVDCPIGIDWCKDANQLFRHMHNPNICCNYMLDLPTAFDIKNVFSNKNFNRTMILYQRIGEIGTFIRSVSVAHSCHIFESERKRPACITGIGPYYLMFFLKWWEYRFIRSVEHVTSRVLFENL